MTISDQADIKFEEFECETSNIKCYDQSGISGNLEFKKCNILSKSQASVKGIYCYEQLDVSTYNQSSVKGKISGKCKLLKIKADQSSIDIKSD